MKRARKCGVGHDGREEDQDEDDWLSLRLKAVDLCNQLIKKQQVNRIVLFTGSGISVLSGIRTYRGEDGIWTAWKQQQRQQRQQMHKEKRKEKRKKEEEEEREEAVAVEKKVAASGGEGEGEGVVSKRSGRRRVSLSKRRKEQEQKLQQQEKQEKMEEIIVEESNGYAWTKITSMSTSPTGRSLTPKNLWFPNVIHMFIAKLVESGLVTCVITQNCDDLHRKSGVPADKLIELHGNSFLEVCPKCKTEYHRDFIVAQPTLLNVEHSSHRTGRFCDKCVTELEDTIVNFNEEIPEERLERALKAGEKCDLLISMGSSLKVEPANEIPLKAKQFVIVNLQETPLDDHAAVVMRGRAEHVVLAMAQKEQLNMEPIPRYMFQFPLVITTRPSIAQHRNQRTTKGNDLWIEIEVNNDRQTIEHFANNVIVSYPMQDESTGSTRSTRSNDIVLNVKNKFKNKIHISNRAMKTWKQSTSSEDNGTGFRIRITVHFNMPPLPAKHKHPNVCNVEHVIPLSVTRTSQHGSLDPELTEENIVVKDCTTTYDLSFDTKPFLDNLSPDNLSKLTTMPKKGKSSLKKKTDQQEPEPELELEPLWRISTR